MTVVKKTALAVAAHPDDIEFKMAGTLVLLREAGWDIHVLNVSTGNCGSATVPPDELIATRGREAEEAAAILGATLHPPFSHDLEIVYDLLHLRKLAAVMHKVAPDIVLTHPPEDYMEDHMAVARLAVTAAFTHSMPNFETDPPAQLPNKEVAIYHAMPHGLCDQLRRPVVPGAFVDVTSVHDNKLQALRAHQSQQGWLDTSQGMNSYLQEMEDQDRAVGALSGKFTHAEGWWRHLHFGFTAEDADPLADALGPAYVLNPSFEGNRPR
jgi:LmbE family N-acetylglucosaminyl deacetylase